MKILIVSFCAIAALFSFQTSDENFFFLLKSNDRHIKEKLREVSFNKGLLVDIEISKEIKNLVNSNTMIKKSNFYLSQKLPYKNRYYFKSSNNTYVIIEMYNQKFLSTIINSKNDVFALEADTLAFPNLMNYLKGK